MFNKELKEEIEELRERVLKAEEKTKNASDIRKCNECGKPFFKRVLWSSFSYLCEEEVKNCEDCDPIIEKRNRAKIIALRCPDEVIKLANKKQCKDK